MKKESMYTPSVTGEPTPWRLWTPEEGQPRAVVQLVHGMAEHIDRYDDTARALTEAGFVVVGHTHIGHGKNAMVPGWFSESNGWQHLLEDIHMIRGLAQERYPDLPYIILGHSMGSFLVRCYIGQHAEGITAAVLSGTGDFDNGTVGAGLMVAKLVCALGGAKKPSNLINKLAFAANNKPFEPARTPFDWLSRDAEQVDRYVMDPACGFLFTGAGYRDLFSGIRLMNEPATLTRVPKTLPLLFISGDKDPVGGMGKGVRAVAERYEQAGVQSVDVMLYQDARHELFNEINRTEVWAQLIGWLNEHLED